MSLHDDLTAVQRCLDDLVRSASDELERSLGSCARRHRRRTPLAPSRRRRSVAEMVPIPDTPYDTTPVDGHGRRGLGVRDRHAP